LTAVAACPTFLLQGHDFECQPIATYAAEDRATIHGNDFNLVAMPLIEAAGLPLLNTWNETVPLYRYHMKHGDCTHFCSSGAYEASPKKSPAPVRDSPVTVSKFWLQSSEPTSTWFGSKSVSHATNNWPVERTLEIYDTSRGCASQDFA
jgi:hypothetical protein